MINERIARQVAVRVVLGCTDDHIVAVHRYVIAKAAVIDDRWAYDLRFCKLC